MTITKKYLESINACKRGIEWFCNPPETNDIKIIERLISEKDSNTDALENRKAAAAAYAAAMRIKILQYGISLLRGEA
jgi:hypothetical protein